MSNIAENKRIIRLLSVTSIQQLFIGLACIKKSNKKSTLYQDYLIINNTMLLDETVESIRNAAKCQNFKMIIDFRQQLTQFQPSSQTNSFRKAFHLIKQRNYAKILFKELREYVQAQNVDEIYVRYKLSFPERIILTAFPEADIHMFEDGLGDYLPKINQHDKNKEKSAQRFPIKNLIHENLLRRNSTILQHSDIIYARIKVIYELVSNSEGHRKEFLQKHSLAPFQCIKNEYLFFAKQAYEKSSLNVAKRSFVLLLPSASSAAFLWYPNPGLKEISISDDIEYTSNIVSVIKSLYPKSAIVIKPHPRSPQTLVEAFASNFTDGVCRVDYSRSLPAETYCFNSHLKAVVGGSYSSCLLYAAMVFDKKTYYCRPPKYMNSDYSKEQIKLNEKTLENFGVEKLVINDMFCASSQNR